MRIFRLYFTGALLFLFSFSVTYSLLNIKKFNGKKVNCSADEASVILFESHKMFRLLQFFPADGKFHTLKFIPDIISSHIKDLRLFPVISEGKTFQIEYLRFYDSKGSVVFEQSFRPGRDGLIKPAAQMGPWGLKAEMHGPDGLPVITPEEKNAHLHFVFPQGRPDVHEIELRIRACIR